MPDSYNVATFCMEAGVDPSLKTYSGGLGILFGDLLKSAADLNYPILGVTLCYRDGYTKQTLDKDGFQIDADDSWNPGDFMKEVDVIRTRLFDQDFKVRCWQYDVRGLDQNSVPLYFLDGDVDGNADWVRRITHRLYDDNYKLTQGALLGSVGYKLLRTLDHDIKTYHINESRSAFLILEMLRQSGRGYNDLKDRFVFTTHTPLSAGHDEFNIGDVENALGVSLGGLSNNGRLHMTQLALRYSKRSNAVSPAHRKVASELFGAQNLISIGNGVHPSWASKWMQELFDQYVPDWKKNPRLLVDVLRVPPDKIEDVHARAKKRLIDYVNKTTDAGLDESILTIGFARRVTPYKRHTLPIRGMKALEEMKYKTQFVFAGKAHPNDLAGKNMIKEIIQASREHQDKTPIAFIPNYDMTIASIIVSGADIWANTPERKLEASGTSGIKAELNGVPNITVYAGWTLNGCIDNLNAFMLGEPCQEHDNFAEDAKLFSRKVANTVAPMYYEDPEAFLKIRQNAIVDASGRTTHTTLAEYASKLFEIPLANYLDARGKPFA